MTTGEVLLQYQQRFHELQAGLANIQSKQWVVLSIAVLAVVMTVGFGLLAHYRKTIPIWYPPLAIPIAVISIRNYGRLRLQADRLKRLSDFYARGKARLAGQWAGKGHSGSEFQPADHPYATDLGVFGEGSLFERICTARTHLGRERLAGYLAEPVGREEAQGRQGAVRELACKIDLREKVALLGKYDFEESRWQTFAQWLDTPSTQQRSKLLRLFFCASSLLLLAMSIAVLIAPSALGLIFWRPICTLAAVQALVAGFLLRWVRVTLAAAAPVANEIKVMREGMTMLSGLKFSAPKLVHLARSAEGADLTIEELDPWFLVLAERSKDWMYQLSIWFALGTQTALALDAWRGRHRTALLRWLDTWAEFEALSALACYAYENPEDCWPEITEACAFLEADALGHPLLARDTCVPNDVVLGYGRKFWVISGS
ncbi:MAG TPA: hypothetical protein VFQ91_15020, partial [Bryobacteraceae bacterium]|nr:hypothetical protein [Bryobacteraceae bacterium]